MMQEPVDLTLTHLSMRNGSGDFNSAVEDIKSATSQSTEFPKHGYALQSVRSHDQHPIPSKQWVELRHAAGATSKCVPDAWDRGAEEKIRLEIHRLQRMLNRGTYSAVYTLELGNSEWMVSKAEYDHFTSLENGGN